MAFELRSFPQIMKTMIATIRANTPLNDVNPGSTLSTFLEAAASEDFNQYYQMLVIIASFALENVTGDDLVNRAIEYGLDGRIDAKKSTTNVTISDTAFIKKATQVYPGLAGPVSGQTLLYVSDASTFTTSGSIIIGRGTTNAETVAYSSITLGVNYDTVNLSAGLLNDHGLEESVILAQGGTRTVLGGTVVKVPASDAGQEIVFTLDANAILQDGENSLTNVAVTAVVEGGAGNVTSGSINTFDSLPFPKATVTNPTSVNNGRDVETDDELRDRIRDTIQSLAKGTSKAIITGIIGILNTEENKRVVSAKLIESLTTSNPTKVIIDDGNGFEASFTGIGFEELISKATGGEEFLALKNFPLVKANVVTLSEEPFTVVDGESLIYQVNGVEETVIFNSSDFQISNAATAQEIVVAINNKATLIEARTAGQLKKIEIHSKLNTNEQIKVTGGTANTALNFPTVENFSLNLYEFNQSVLKLLNKDGITASLINSNLETYNLSGSPTYLDIQLDNETLHSGMVGVGSGLNTVIDITLGNRFTANADISNQYVTFLSGVNKGVSVFISAYNFGSNTLTLTGGLTATSGDLYQINDSERIHFSNINGQDFVLSSAATAKEVVNVINTRVEGLARLTDSKNRLQLVSKTINSNLSQIKIHGGTANSILGFSTTLVVGKNSDYLLNRFNGQIELLTPAVAGNNYTAGTSLAQAFTINGVTQPYLLTNGDTISISIDSGITQVITFLTAGFSNITQATSQEIVNIINQTLIGGIAEVTSDGRVLIKTNTYDETVGKIQITAVSGTATNLLFTVGVEVTGLVPHNAYTSTANAAPFNFVKDDNLIIVVDQNIVGKTFDIKMDLSGTVATVSSPLISFTATLTTLGQNFNNKFTNDNDLTNMKVVWETATNGANVGIQRTITAYNKATGLITLSSNMPAAITATDTFIMLPVTIKNMVVYLNNTSNSTFSLVGKAAQSNGGTKIQLSSNTLGAGGYIQVSGGTANAISSPLVLDGSGFNLYVKDSSWKIGMDLQVDDNDSSPLNTSVTAVTPDTPSTGIYQLTMANNVSAYSVSQSAFITRLNDLGFNSSLKQGVDAYRYYTGLLAQTQKTIDGVENDQTYPGIKAAGSQIEVLSPTVKQVKVIVDVTLIIGITLSAVTDDVKSVVSGYINSLKVGEDVIINEIIKRVKSLPQIQDLKILTPTANIVIFDSEIARITNSNITVG